MPLFRFIHPTPDNADAAYSFVENPDPEKFVQVADGGVVTEPTLAIVGDGSPELIIPAPTAEESTPPTEENA